MFGFGLEVQVGFIPAQSSWCKTGLGFIGFRIKGSEFRVKG
jgi:hypothetical protein